MGMDSMTDTLDITAAAEYLHASESQVHELVRSGALRGAKVGRSWVFRLPWLQDYLDAESLATQEALRAARKPVAGKRALPDLGRYGAQ
jgi:excisionase family DNA binding protein